MQLTQNSVKTELIYTPNKTTTEEDLTTLTF